MKELKYKAIALFIILFIWWLFATINDTSCWNDGHCECGGNWVYEQAVGYRYSTYFYYHCDKCGKVIELCERR